MNEDIKAWWVEALLNDEYKQGFRRLRVNHNDGPDSFCCLGVLCDLYAKEMGAEWTVKDGLPSSSYFLGVSAVLPDVVRDWAGLSDNNPIVFRDGVKEASLADLNDEHHSFPAIAAVIKEQL